MYLLDTNLLSSEKVLEHVEQEGGPFFISSVSAQELLGMQRPGKETGYIYALPVLDEHMAGFRHGMSPEMYMRASLEHAKRFPVSKQTDRLIIPRSKLSAGSLELGHTAVAIAHAGGHDRLFRAFALRGLRGKKLQRVLSKWELLRDDVDTVIPLDDEITAHAVVLANRFMDDGHHVKGTARNTMNDMLVAATAQIGDIPLLTDDSQLRVFYQEQGWSVEDRDQVFVATPPLGNPDAPGITQRRSESRGYINRPRSLRSPSCQAPPPFAR